MAKQEKAVKTARKTKTGSGGLGIQFKMLAVILPTVILALVIMAIVLSNRSKEEIHTLTEQSI